MMALPAADEVHVWSAHLPSLAAQEASLAALLSADEGARRARFLVPSERQRYALSRGVLRKLMAAYTGLPPEQLAFAYGPQGKPLPAGRLADAGLEFNLAHSGELAVYAVTRGRRVGVDVERARDVPEAGQIAARHFAAEEQAAWERLAPEKRLAAFFRIWTRREAFAKATGKGLGEGWAAFAVSVEAAAPRLWHIGGDAAAAGEWTLCDLTLPESYYGAVAAEGRGLVVREGVLPADVLT
jgi:4'-phosphopantetheinyl transferase